MLSEDYIALPDRIYDYQYVELSVPQLKQYRKFEREYVTSVAGKTIEAKTAADLSGKLLQLASGIVYDAQKNENVFHDEKIEALREIVEEAGGTPILIAYWYKSDLRRIKKAFPKAVELDSKRETEDRWNRGEIEILLAHPMSAGHGLNLQHGGNVIVWFGACWSLESYLQLNKRLHRTGQKHTVYIKHLLTKNTIDELVIKVLSQKDASQQRLLDALKDKYEPLLSEEENETAW
jgi:SNF2 family DNA or RNA helicase